VKIRYTYPALADLEAILDYIARQSPQGALRVQRRIDSVLALIAEQPRSGTLTDDATIRRQVVRPYPYLIFYEVTDDEIIIHAVRHGARDPASMPGESRDE
jgi:plasmid stabilization system protein ParE